MGEATKKIISFASLEDQFMARTELYASAGSSSQVLQKPSSKSIAGNAEESTNPMLDLQLAIPNTYFTQAEKNLINDHNPNKSQAIEGQAVQLDFDLNSAPKMEGNPERLNRLIANRRNSRTYRLKQTLRMTNLENLSRSLGTKIDNMRAQIEENKIWHRSMLIENHQLKFRMAALEKHRVHKEDEIVMNRAEVNRLKELRKKQLQVKEHAMNYLGAGLPTDNAQFDLNNSL